MENLNFLLAAYSATWVVLFFYVYSLRRKQSRIAEEIRRLKQKMEREDNRIEQTQGLKSNA